MTLREKAIENKVQKQMQEQERSARREEAIRKLKESQKNTLREWFEGECVRVAQEGNLIWGFSIGTTESGETYFRLEDKQVYLQEFCEEYGFYLDMRTWCLTTQCVVWFYFGKYPFKGEFFHRDQRYSRTYEYDLFVPSTNIQGHPFKEKIWRLWLQSSAGDRNSLVYEQIDVTIAKIWDGLDTTILLPDTFADNDLLAYSIFNDVYFDMSFYKNDWYMYAESYKRIKIVY